MGPAGSGTPTLRGVHASRKFRLDRVAEREGLGLERPTPAARRLRGWLGAATTRTRPRGSRNARGLRRATRVLDLEEACSSFQPDVPAGLVAVRVRLPVGD